MDITNSIKDVEFRNFVIQNYCNGNQYILKSDIENVKSLILPKQNYLTTENEAGEYITTMTSGLPIRSLEGIAYFNSLEVFICSGNRTIEGLDLSKNKNLKVLHCSGNEIKQLPLCNITIEEIDCSYNPLEKLDVSQFANLKVLNCGICKLSEIHLERNTKLETLICRYNPLKTLDVAVNPQIKILDCNSTKQLEQLDLGENKKLEELDCGFNSLTDLNTDSLTSLKKLICYHNKLITLNLENNKELEYLSCSYNQIGQLDVSRNINLIHLECASNKLIQLNIANNIHLKILDCNYNYLTNIDLAKNVELIVLKIFNNQLTEIDVSRNEKLERFICSDNKLTTTPDISNNKLINYFNYNGNPIPEPDFPVKGVGIFKYDIDSTEYNLLIDDIYITVAVSNLAGIKKLSASIKKVMKNLDSLKSQIMQFLEKNCQGEDASTLMFCLITFQSDKTFKLAYDAGESPAGRLFLYFEFDKDMNLKEEIIYETY